MPNLNEYAPEYSTLLNMENAGDNINKIIDDISKFVAEHKDNISTSQLRNIYGKAKATNDVVRLKMLRPKLAYIAARNKDAKNFIDTLDKVIQKVNTPEQLKGFKMLFESVVAYHKYHSEFK